MNYSMSKVVLASLCFVKVPGLPDALQLMIKEGAMIMGYVSMWKPLSILLYDWWPIRTQLVQLRELGEIDIDLISSTGVMMWSSGQEHHSQPLPENPIAG